MKRQTQRSKGHSYLREVQIRFKKKRVKSNLSVAEPLTDSRKVYELFKDLQDETKEKLITISIDLKLKIICFEVVAIGSVDTIFVRPFEAIRAILLTNPYGFIVVHNHTSGDPKPSPHDKKFTKKLKKMAEIAGVTFLDHIIIGEDRYFSFSDKGLLK